MGALTCTHRTASFKNKQTTSHLDGLMRAHAYPSVLLKNAKATRLRARGLFPHSDLATGQN
jgi:hypothetical protein